jgi:hypothetical protein
MSCAGGIELSQSTGATSLGASISATGQSGELNAEAGYTEDITFSGTLSTITCPAGNGAVECYGGGAPNDPQAGTQLEAALYFTVNGTVSGTDLILDPPTNLSATINGHPLYGVGGTGATGTLVSSGFSFQADIPVTLGVSFGVVGACGSGGCSADFSDPDFTDILITDPSTGLPVLGLTATGDDGTIFPVDVGISETPEPSSLVLLAAGFTGLGIASRRRLCQPAQPPSTWRSSR